MVLMMVVDEKYSGLKLLKVMVVIICDELLCDGCGWMNVRGLLFWRD
jgi:hypothetical protein